MMPGSYQKKEYSNGRLIIPKEYRSYLNLRQTEEAIKFIKDNFQIILADNLNLNRVSAPIAALCDTGINDHLNGVERPVRFEIPDIDKRAEIVQSLAKWKRLAVADYGFEPGEGLYTDMNAIRPDEMLDNTHSIYVDQWDWERAMGPGERNIDFLKSIVKKIYAAIRAINYKVCEKYSQLPILELPEEISFVQSEDLQESYPSLTPFERETEVCREKKAVFVIGIGADLADGKAHDGRASDYDDWSSPTKGGYRGLNGDILVYNPLFDSAYELSSMGIRVDKMALLRQLKIRDEDYKKELYFHKRLLDGDLPQTIGGGIGQSRLCMYYLQKASIGEVQTSIWPEAMKKDCKDNGIFLL